MLIDYIAQRRSIDEILQSAKAKLERVDGRRSDKKLIHGDNLPVLRSLIEDYDLVGQVKLVYIDPPFATNSHFRIGDDRVSTISSSASDRVAYSDVLVDGEFLNFLRERLILIRELMAEDGSIYLHIDYKVGHYVRVVMDEVFGRENFRNEITRIKCNPKNFHRRAFGNVKDMILFYTKSARSIWNDPRSAFVDAEVPRRFAKIDASGRRYTTIPLHAPGETKGKTGMAWRGIMPPCGRHWRTAPVLLEKWERQGLIEWSKNGVPRKKIYADESQGKKMQDVWEFKDPQYPNYPTEKNLDMLKLIIDASSNEGDLVLDCFCGSGTTLVAADTLKRNWIGIDQSKQAIIVAKRRLSATLGHDVTPRYEALMQVGLADGEQEGLAPDHVVEPNQHLAWGEAPRTLWGVG